MRVVLTQPQPRVAAMAARLGLAGHEVITLGFSRVRMLLDSPSVRSGLSRLDAADWVIPVSPTAVDALVEHRSGAQAPLRARIGLIGPGSLEHWRAGLASDPPLLPRGRSHDGASLVAEPEFATVAGLRIVLLQSAQRRPPWSDVLVERGGIVEVVRCYEVEEQVPADDEAVELLGWLRAFGRDDWQAPVISTSSVALARACVSWLRRCVPPEYEPAIARCDWFVQHARIAQALRDSGFERVRIVKPGEAGLLEALESRP